MALRFCKGKTGDLMKKAKTKKNQKKKEEKRKSNK